MLKTDTWLKIISSMMINAVVFGVGAIVVLSIPALAEHAIYLIPAVVVISFVVAPILSFYVAPRMRLKYWGERRWKKGDSISG
ncbi:hypothetical protein FE840_001490 [Peteryoungia desertarenae]|uniref:Uncharacterized protein n=1 Tax=Peteryoungia desertarenae TaxID=1813451 RepID=A0ABX6QID2_9HYPH|nr:hypothetical protein [Peteryoungia desertarenae]QLF68331.1 hypothetical protein FE840_001490 [Peteryoungia desertarenae]